MPPTYHLLGEPASQPLKIFFMKFDQISSLLARMAGDADGALRLSQAAGAMRSHGRKLEGYAKDGAFNVDEIRW